MRPTLCFNCFSHGYCRKTSSRIVSDDEMTPAFVSDVKETARSLNVSPYDWREHLSDLYRDYKGRIIDEDGNEVFLDTEVFEFPHHREWSRDFMAHLAEGSAPRIRAESRERIRVMASILRAAFPAEADMWGVRAANDNAQIAQ